MSRRRSRLRQPTRRNRGPSNPPMRSDPIMLFPTRSLKGHVAAVIACAGFAFAPQVAGKAAAQSTVSGVPNAMQGFSQNRDQPIQIESVSLEMRDKKKEATF